MRKNSVFNQENSYLNSWYNITKGFGEFFKERSAGISQREIAHSLIVSEANITKTFKKLEGKELVYKTVDEDNNARRNLHLTEKGEATFERCIEIFGEFDEITFEDYDSEEKEKMEKQLKKISDKSLNIIKK